MDDLDRQLGLADAAGTADDDVDRRRAAVQMPGDGQQLGGAADKMRVWRKGRARAGGGAEPARVEGALPAARRCWSDPTL
jgi:hypothetical protein